MSEEQPIFVSSEDDLADVRERLAKITSRKVTLVIPSQTRLHSPVAWKLLHRDARQLGKDILIVSTDPQVRSVAQSVKFRVAHSLESSPSGKSMPGTRPSRSGQAVRGRGAASMQGRAHHSQQHPPSARRGSEQGQVGPRSQLSGQESRASQTSRASQSSEWSDPLSDRPRLHREPESEGPEINETITGGLSEPGNSASSTFEVFESSEPIYGKPYEYRIDTPPPILPLPQESIEEPNLLAEDFERARDIRQAALGGEKLSSSPPAPAGGRQGNAGARYRPAPLPHESDDPFEYMNDAQPAPSPEQRGAVSIEGFDTTEQAIRGDISDYPTSVLENDIEYEGDLGDFVERANRPLVTRPWDEPDLEEEPRIYGRRARSSRSGHIPEVPESARVVDALPTDTARTRPASNQPPLSPPRPPQQQRPPQPLNMPNAGGPRSAPIAPGAGNSRTSKQLPGSQTRPAPAKTTAARAPQTPQAPQTRPGRPTPSPASGSSRTGRPTDTSRRPAPAARPKRRGGGIGILVAIALLLLAAGLAYFVPSADVSITLPSAKYTQNLTLTATASQSGGAGQTIAASVLSNSSLTVSQSNFKATGSRPVGDSAASGQVIFTNNGPVQVTIPTGTVIETTGNNPVQFLTTAEGVAAPATGGVAGTSPLIQITAQQKGADGDVAAAAITTIPPDSLQKIAQYNTISKVSSLNLGVSNAVKTTGGGTINQPVVTQKDLQAASDALHPLLQSKADAWVPPLGKGDQMGKPYLDNVSPLTAPAVGADANGGVFTATLKGTASVLVVHNVALQNAAGAGLSALLAKDTKIKSEMLYVDTNNPITLANVQVKSSSDNKTLTFSFSATGTILPNLTADQVRSLIVGRSISDARNVLNTQIPGTQNVVIVVSPGIVSWISFWTGHINVHIKPGAPTPAKT